MKAQALSFHRHWPVQSPRLAGDAGSGFGGLALAAILADRGKAGDSPTPKPSDPRSTHFAPKVKHVIHVFLEGGPSHVDLFDPKPELSRNDGKPIPVPGENRKAPAFGSPFRFASAGNRASRSAMPYPCLVTWPTTSA